MPDSKIMSLVKKFDDSFTYSSSNRRHNIQLLTALPCLVLSFRVKTVKYQSMPALAFLVLMEEPATFILAMKTTSGTTVFVIKCYAMWKFCQWYQLLVSNYDWFLGSAGWRHMELLAKMALSKELLQILQTRGYFLYRHCKLFATKL